MTEIQHQDDSIELEDFTSTQDSTENLLQVQSSSTFAKFQNKIRSPTIQSPIVSPSTSSNISDIFVVKPNVEPAKRQLKPVPAPRKILKKTESNLSLASDTLEKKVKKLSVSTDTVSGDVQSIFSAKSDTLSYKERLRNRFLAVKKQAKKSVIQTQDDKKDIKRKKKKSLDSTDSVFENEDIIINAELNKYKKSKSKLNNKELSAYDFFCSVDEKEPDNNEPVNLLNKRIKNKSNEESERESVENDETSKQSLNEFLGIDNLDTDVVEYLSPEIIDISSYEKEVFKNNKRKKIKKKNVDPDFEPRYLEEEGIFKGENPNIPRKHLIALEERLSCEENRDWFGPDGKLNIVPDPRLDKCFKPFQSDVKHSDFLHEYTPPTLYEPMENMTNASDNTLEIILHDITFKHHPLFTKEHVIAQKLITLFDCYKKIVSTNTCSIYSKKLEALRAAKDRLINQLESAGEVSNAQATRYEKYLSEIKETREKMYTTSKNERQLKKSILLIWKTLKNIRKTQKYSNTTVKLIIKRENVDYENEIKVWEQNVSEEVSEIVQEHETKFDNEMQEYKEELKEWKSMKKDLKHSEEQGDFEENLPEKPQKPKRNFSEDQIKFEIIEKCNECLKPPGEPLIEFELCSENDISEEINLPKERLRRNLLYKTQIFVKILYNKREICKSKCITLDNKFVCNFAEQISVQIFKVPYTLTLEIYEQTSTISKRLLAELHFKIPKFNCCINNTESVSKQFLNKDIISYNHTAVGTGIKINDIIKANDLDLVENEEQLFCNGILSYSIGWAKESTLTTESHPLPLTRPIFPRNLDLDSLKEWIKKYPDPQDPQNAMLFDYIKSLDLNMDEDRNYFRLEPEMDPFTFCDDSDIENNPRFKLLKLRDNNEPEFKGLVVPNRIKEIPSDVFENYEKRIKEEQVSSDALNDQFEDNIDVQRKWANKYLEQAENRIVQLSKIAERRMTLKDVINEEIIPSIGSLGLTFMNWLQPKRPLRPARKPVKQIQAAVTFKEIKIMTNVIGAIQVPIRKDPEAVGTSKSDQIAVISVRPFVMVSFQGVTVRTTVAEGPNPIWNQEFTLQLRNTNGNLTSASLQNVKDSLVFNLYDETIDDLIVDDRNRDANIHQQLGCNWLGRMEIPFTTLLYNNRVEGTFKVNLPPILLGYERQSIKAFQASGEPFTQKIDTFLTVFITLQPAVGNLQEHIKNELECNELQYLEEFVTNWQTQFNELYPHRRFTSFVTNINGERCCITRYLKPIKLPQLDSDITEGSELQCAKYVSLIPFRENSAAGLIPDIWLTAEQILTLMMGSVKDHATLLTCYLMTLGIKTWLLLGYGMPYGYTAYVLTRENSSLGFEYYIYDVKTAQKYNVHDNICPLQKVFCVINDENIWGNIQDEERLHLTKFDFTKSSDWLQLFGREVSAPISSFQQTNIIYHEAPSVLLLQERIERKLRKKILKWRKYSLTTWNRYCTVILKRLLPKLEEHNMEKNDFNSPEHLTELQNLLSTYQIRGFAMNFPYTTISKIIEFIQETGIHLNENPSLEFSLAVYVKSYMNNAVVIWLYLVTLVRRR